MTGVGLINPGTASTTFSNEQRTQVGRYVRDETGEIKNGPNCGGAGRGARFDGKTISSIVEHMCGRYTIKDPRGAALQIAIITGEPIDVVAARYNCSPSQVMRIILGGEKPRAQDTRWGLIPFWDKSEKPKMAPINARSEEAFAKPMFRQGIQRRRCAIPADGFFEWHKLDEKVKVPYHICRRDNAPFFFAGIYEEATEIRPSTYLLFTCAPNELMVPIHDRMPAILPTDRIQSWLQPGNISAEEFAGYCQPYPVDALQAYPVSPLVNKPANDSPECVQPLATITFEIPPRVRPTEPDLFG